MTLLLGLLTSHAAIALTWAVLAVTLTGIGLLYRRRTTRSSLDALELLWAFWTGFALVLFFLQLWHLVRPVSAGALAVVLALGGAGIARERRSIRSWMQGKPWAGAGLFLLLASVLVAWTANRSIGPVTNYDSGMYHIPVLAWSKAHAIVPGLANLHGRLAFNSSSLLFAAMLDHGPWSGRATHIANSLLVVMFGLQAALAWGRLVGGAVRSQAADVFDAVLLLPVLAVLVGGEVSSIETDTPVALMALAVASRLHRSLIAADDALDLRRSHFAGAALLLGATVCVKLSAVVLGGALFLTAVWVYREALAQAWRATLVSVLAPVTMGLVWMARGVILSGYPVYPATALGVSVPWRVSHEQAIAEAAWIRMSAHELNHNRIVAGFDWLVPWAKEIVTDVRFVFLVPVPFLATLAIGALAWWRWRHRSVHPTQSPLAPTWVLAIPALVGAAFWFVVAPHPRFGMGPAWLAAALASAAWFALGTASADVRQRQLRRMAGLLAVACLVGLASIGFFMKGTGTGRRAGDVRMVGSLFFLPGPDHGLYPAPTSTFVSYTTASGLGLIVPKDNNMCWQAPLLCTPHPAPNLRLRNPADVGAGFVADDGIWQPVRWPNPWTPFRPWLACRSSGPAGVRRDRDCIARTAKAVTDTLERVTSPLPERDGAPSR